MRPFTAPGLFAYRYMQANGLLHFPDFGDGDMTREQRRETLDRFVVHMRPLTAVVIFLNVVALEDFIRDLGIRISKIENLSNYFPNIGKLDVIPQKPNPNKPSKQIDKDPIPSIMDFVQLNELYLGSIGVDVIKKQDYSRLYDLTIIRHCVAHNGSIVRDADLPRFQYYVVRPNEVINPPVDFVKETCLFLYQTGRHFEETIRDKVFKEVISKLDKDWITKKPRILIDLIELFNFFGKLYPPTDSMPMTEIEMKNESEKNHQLLLKMCFEELETKFKV